MSTAVGLFSSFHRVEPESALPPQEIFSPSRYDSKLTCRLVPLIWIAVVTLERCVYCHQEPVRGIITPALRLCFRRVEQTNQRAHSEIIPLVLERSPYFTKL